MNFFNNFKNTLTQTRRHLTDNSVESIIWLVNLIPSKVGFSILNDKISAPFWIIHLSLLTYVYGAGSIVYQIYHAQGAGDYIKSYVNISILILTANNSYWFLMKRSLLNDVLEQVMCSDHLARASDSLRDKHKKLLSIIKKILFIFYGCNCMNLAFIYLPHRVSVANDYYSMTHCVGLEPLTRSPNREVCLAILLVEELSISTVVLNYQALLLFLIAHTAGMYQILAAEMMAFNEYDDNEESRFFVRQRLPILIKRHVLILSIIEKLKALYSMPIGVNFGTNVVCMSLFFYLTLRECISFSPILIYCFLVFFLYCYVCQRLINASEVFENAVYCCGWEKFDLKEQKTIYVMYMQAQRPVVLLAADIVPINIYTFATTLRGMFQFITVFKF